MAFTDGKDDGPKGFVKRVASSFSMRKKKKNATSCTEAGERKLLPRSKSTGCTNYESMKLPKKISDVTIKTRIKSSSGVTQLPRREKIDDRGGDGTNNNFGKWRSFDDSDSIWLSSDCASPTSLLEEPRLSVTFRFNVDESVVSWLSNLANTSLSLNHHQEPSSTIDRCRIPRNTKDHSENIQKKACAPNSTVSDSNTQSSQGKRVSFSPSSGTEFESENLSPSTSLAHEKSEDSKKSSNVADEPLFWPYEQRFDWTPEDILKHFSMSPRRKKSLVAKVTSPRSMRAQLLQTRKVDLKDGCKRKLVFNGPVTNASKMPELKRAISHSSSNNKKNDSIKNEPVRNCVKRNKSLPSRLRKSSKTCSKVVPIEASEEVIAAEKVQEVEITARKLMNRRSKTMLEDDFALMNDFSIENAVGLAEFSGREGIDSEFNSDTFLFDDSL
ncbi:unnamed protein product [Microthlaspi erraticum]|uniref:Uncharacterized protein n=1 Tax=Microthlaspi erraticum TaxID=1685480 RepID=A0A6D2IHH3_9BRAS|nr:unnamed protein product [Microthlaspi erraticum]